MGAAKRRVFGRGYPSGTSNWAQWARRHPQRSQFYASTAWKWARSQQLAREPNCRICGEPARAVDHVIPISQGGEPLDPDNLQSLCRRHHNTKTTHEGHEGMKRAARRKEYQWQTPANVSSAARTSRWEMP
jgi:5-methylcytosine-specific restriction endonuclease McrA